MVGNAPILAVLISSSGPSFSLPFRRTKIIATLGPAVESEGMLAQAVTPAPEVFRRLRLHRAVVPFLMSFAAEPDVTIERAIAMLHAASVVSVGEKLIIVTDIVAQEQLVDSIQLRTVH